VRNGDAEKREKEAGGDWGRGRGEEAEKRGAQSVELVCVIIYYLIVCN